MHIHTTTREAIENFIAHLEDYFLVKPDEPQEGYCIIHKPSKGSLIIEDDDFCLEVVQAMLDAGVEITDTDGLRTFVYGNDAQLP